MYTNENLDIPHVADHEYLKTLIDSLPMPVFWKDVDSCYRGCNKQFLEYEGFNSKDELLGKNDYQMPWKAYARQYRESDKQILKSKKARYGYEECQVRDNGSKRWYITSKIPLIDENGTPIGIMVYYEDITEQKEMGKKLGENDQFLSGVLNDLKTYLGILDPDGKIIFINNTPLNISKLELSQLQGRYFYDAPWWSSVETRNLIKRDLETCATGTQVSRKIQANMGSRDLRWISFSSHPVVDETGKITRLIVEGRDVSEDVSEVKQAQVQLQEEKERLQVTLHSIGDAVITTDTQGIVDYMNPAAEKLTAWAFVDALGQPLNKVLTIVGEQDFKPCLNPVKLCLEQEKVVSLGNQVMLINRLGEEYLIQNSAAPIQDADQNLLGVVLAFSDITESQRLTKQLAFHASHDTLTELVNRREFEARLERAMYTAKQNQYQHVLCYMDLDQFKIVNDSCGHVAGDELLRQIAALLNDTIRGRDTLARLGGDEFAVLMEHCSLDQAQKIAEKVRQVISDSRFSWQNRIFNISVSIGIVSIYNTDKSSSDLLCDADAACYSAKRAGRDRVHVYQDDDLDLVRQRSDMEWFSRIHQALELGQFCLYYQPIYSFNQSKGLRYELLVRMKDSQEKLIFPSTFLPAAEHYAITTKIDRWVLQEAFQWLTSIPDHLKELDHCAINLSGHSLGDKDFLNFLVDLFEETNLPAEKICLEITETAAIANLPGAQYFINTLQKLGCRFALDDFGIGLSSFAYLKNLDVDYLKIDGSFVKNILTDPDDFAIVKSINEIGHTMGKLTIAEFAENSETLKCLDDMGVDFAQGYAINRPRSISEIGLPVIA